MREDHRSRKFDYLDHMIEAISLARSFTEGMAKPDFLADRKTRQAVILNLIVLGGAASKFAARSGISGTDLSMFFHPRRAAP